MQNQKYTRYDKKFQNIGSIESIVSGVGSFKRIGSIGGSIESIGSITISQVWPF